MFGRERRTLQGCDVAGEVLRIAGAGQDHVYAGFVAAKAISGFLTTESTEGTERDLLVKRGCHIRSI